MKTPVLLLALGLPIVAFSAPEPLGPPPAELRVPGFHKKYISANGYPIVASERVSDYALREAAYLVNLLLAKRPDVRKAMIESGSRMCILAHNEFTTDLPEFARLKPKDYWDARARGTGGSRTDPYCSCGEENLLGYPGDPYAAECILIHEFAHNIHLRGMVRVDPTFDDRVKACFDGAMARGLWKKTYASTNAHEYFAEGVQSWFDNNRPPDHDHNHVDTRDELREYDPGLAALCSEVFGDTVLKYTRPTTRLTGHLTGYDPARAPTFSWPERLSEARAAIRTAARNRGAEGGMETREVRGWKLHISRRLLAERKDAVEAAVRILEGQLAEIVQVVPGPVVAKLREVPLWFSPEYPGVPPTAEYHPGEAWLREHGRNPAMVRSVEFTNIGNFEREARRMPNFALHELAHAYHHRVLGHDQPDLRRSFEQARESKRYDSVEQRFGDGTSRTTRAYALNNVQEYFAELSEAFFSRNDFFPFTRADLEKHDPDAARLLARLWESPKP